MRHLALIAILLAFCGCGKPLPEGVEPADLDPVSVPDPVLADAIRMDVFWSLSGKSSNIELDRAAAKDSIPLNRLTLRSIGELAIENQPVSSLEGIQFCVNLQKLRLVNCGLEDISFVKSLPGLRDLDLSNNRIHDISPLGQFKGFHLLTLDQNRIEDITPLHAMDIRMLGLNTNRIKNMDVVQYMKIGWLHISWNLITDVPPLDNVELGKIAIGNNPLSERACRSLWSYKTSGHIDSVVLDCPEPTDAIVPAESTVSAVVYVADGTYHRLKDCAALNGKTVGVTKTSKAIEKGLTPCSECFNESILP